MIVLWRITTRCNYACGFCAYDRRLGGPRQDVGAEEAERFGHLLGRWGRATGQDVMLSWLGGEPLLWKPILPLSGLLARQGGVRISATTNGSGLGSARMRSAILESFAELTISIDGFAAAHDDLRGAPGGWRRARDGARALARERAAAGAALRLRANIVLMHSNLHDFPELCLELAEWGVDEITFNQLGGRDRPEYFPAHRLRPRDVEALARTLKPLKAALAERGTLLCGDSHYLERVEASAAGRAVAVDDCRLGEDFLFIDEAGMIAPCSFSTAEYGVPISDLTTIEDLNALAGRYRRAEAAARCGACADCPSTQVFAKFAA